MFCPKCGNETRPLDSDRAKPQLHYCEKCKSTYKKTESYTYEGWKYQVEEIL